MGNIVPPLEARATYNKPRSPVPCRGIFPRTGLTVSQHSGHLPQKTNTGPQHAPSAKCTDQRVLQSNSFGSDGNRTRLSVSFCFVLFVCFSFGNRLIGFLSLFFVLFCFLLLCFHFSCLNQGFFRFLFFNQAYFNKSKHI